MQSSFSTCTPVDYINLQGDDPLANLYNSELAPVAQMAEPIGGKADP
jgi:hypothetical protein